MGYILTKSDNETLILLNDGQIDTAITSLTLVGKNVSNFGDAQNENFLHLLENFANSSARLGGSGQPRSPLRGQLWFDTNPEVNRLLVYDGSNWRPLAVSIYGTTTTNTLVNATAGPPIPFAANKPGDFFFDTTNKKLYVVSGTSTELTLIGPESVIGFADTRMFSTTMFDSGNSPRPVIQMIVDGEVVAVVSSSTFQVSNTNPVPGFGRVYRGVTFKNYNSSTRYTTATTDVQLHGLHEQLDSTYTRRNVNETINANWSVSTGQVLYFGSTNNSSIFWNTATSALTLSTPALSNLRFAVGNNSLTFNGTDLLPASSGYNIGSETLPFENLYSKKLSSGNSLSTGTIEGDWVLSSGSQLEPNSDLSNNLGSLSKRFDNVYLRTLNPGNSLGYVSGIWNLNSGATLAPSVNLGNDLGQSSKRFNTLFVSTVSGLTSIIGSTNIAGNLLPESNNLRDLGSSSFKWATIHTSDIQADSAFIGTLQIGNTNILISEVTTGTFNSLQASNASITRLISSSGTFASLFATNGTISILNSPTATLGTTSITNGTVGNLSAASGTINSLTSQFANFTTATIGRATITNGVISSLTATNASVVTLSAANASIPGSLTLGTLNATSAGIGSLAVSGNMSVYNTLTAANIVASNNLQGSSITAGNANITNLAVANNGVFGGNITALQGNITTINADNITVSQNITSQGTSNFSFGTQEIRDVKEKVLIVPASITGSVNVDLLGPSVIYYTSTSSGNWTFNFRGSSSVTTNSYLGTGQSVTVTVLVTQGPSAFYPSSITVDGSPVTPKWFGGIAPTSGDPNSVDAYMFTIVKTGSAAYSVFASVSKYA